MQDDKQTFEEIIAADPNLAELSQLDGSEVVDRNSYGGVDGYGNDFTMLYHEEECAQHGPEPALIIVVNGEGAMFHLDQAPKLVGWLNEMIAQGREKGLLD